MYVLQVTFQNGNKSYYTQGKHEDKFSEKIENAKVFGNIDDVNELGEYLERTCFVSSYMVKHLSDNYNKSAVIKPKHNEFCGMESTKIMDVILSRFFNSSDFDGEDMYFFSSAIKYALRVGKKGDANKWVEDKEKAEYCNQRFLNGNDIISGEFLGIKITSLVNCLIEKFKYDQANYTHLITALNMAFCVPFDKSLIAAKINSELNYLKNVQD